MRNDKQNQGIGNAIIKDVLKKLLAEYKEVILWCAKDNIIAKKFYERNGFVYKEERKCEFGDESIIEEKYVFNLQQNQRYKISRLTSFSKKENEIAVYVNFDLLFFKNQSAKWFMDIVNRVDLDEIPVDFIQYLLKKEVIEIE